MSHTVQDVKMTRAIRRDKVDCGEEFRCVGSENLVVLKSDASACFAELWGKRGGVGRWACVIVLIWSSLCKIYVIWYLLDIMIFSFGFDI